MSAANVTGRRPVMGMMPRVTSWALGTALLCLAGCQGPKPTATTPEAPAQPTTRNESATGVPRDPTTPPASPPPAGATPGVNVAYTPSTMGLPDVGSKTDAGIMGLKNGRAAVTMHYKGGEGEQLDGGYAVKVRDNTTYRIDYALLQTEYATNRLAADGKSRMVYEDRKWKKATPRDASGPMSGADIEAWLKRFPAEVLSGLQDGAPVWKRLLAALSADPAWSTKMEESNVAINKVERPIYRITSQKLEAKDEKLEIVIDGKRWLPVTVKANYKDDKGKPVEVYWTAAWSFGGTFKDDEFKIALPKP